LDRAIQLKNVDFELDSINVVTRFHIKKVDESEFGVMIRDCLGDYNSFLETRGLSLLVDKQMSLFIFSKSGHV
jgi:hypothetical protein